MRTIPVLLLTGLLALAGCGDEDPTTSEAPRSGETASEDGEAMKKETASEDGEATKKETAGGTTIVVADSEFGSMLFGSDKQAIYIFEKDPEDESVCYGECADAWPPVLTDGDPTAGKGVDASLLGTVERRGGERQVTYAGKPLYFYAHEAPGEVRCHNVNLNGGLWWVVGPDGKRRA